MLRLTRPCHSDPLSRKQVGRCVWQMVDQNDSLSHFSFMVWISENPAAELRGLDRRDVRDKRDVEHDDR